MAENRERKALTWGEKYVGLSQVEIRAEAQRKSKEMAETEALLKKGQTRDGKPINRTVYEAKMAAIDEDLRELRARYVESTYAQPNGTRTMTFESHIYAGR